MSWALEKDKNVATLTKNGDILTIRYYLSFYSYFVPFIHEWRLYKGVIIVVVTQQNNYVVGLELIETTKY